MSVKKEDLEKLKETIEYKWRVQSQQCTKCWKKYGKEKCSCGADIKVTKVAYIDARDVMDLLDRVVGMGDWRDEYYQVKNNVYCKIGINIDNDWVYKSDCGVESDIEGEKGEASDAFKRAAVKWGIGRFLYELDIEVSYEKPKANYSTPAKTPVALSSNIDQSLVSTVANDGKPYEMEGCIQCKGSKAKPGCGNVTSKLAKVDGFKTPDGKVFDVYKCHTCDVQTYVKK